jgi:antitoxin component of MazEF toxin-antitoxin module
MKQETQRIVSRPVPNRAIRLGRETKLSVRRGPHRRNGKPFTPKVKPAVPFWYTQLEWTGVDAFSEDGLVVVTIGTQELVLEPDQAEELADMIAQASDDAANGVDTGSIEEDVEDGEEEEEEEEEES